MKKALKKMLVLGIICMLVIKPAMYMGAETTAQETVRVGLYEMDGFQYYDKYGGLSGYNIEYLNLLATITGWTYEYVPVKDFQDGCEQLLDYKIDLLAPAMWTEQRSILFAYSEMPFGTEYTVLVTNKDNKELYYEDYESYNGLDVAVVKNYPLTDYFIKFMKEHEFEANPVYYDTVEEARNALNNKEVDALVTSIMDMNADTQKLLARFSPQSFYFLTWRGNEKQLEALNEAMFRVENTYPTFLDEMFEKYYPIYSAQFYSREEQEYIKNHDPLRVAYVDGRMPLSFKNEDGKLEGISRAIFDRISELSGLEFEYVALPSGQITYRYLLEQNIDLITAVEYNSVNSNSPGILLSTPYLSSKKVMVSRDDFAYDGNENYKIAVVSGSLTLATVLSAKYPNMQIVEYDTMDDCFNALYNEEVDLLIQNQYVVDGIMSRPRYEEVVVVPVEGLDDELCFSTIVSLYGMEGMSEEESLIITSILNKAISQLTEDELDNIIIRETLANQYGLTLLDFLYNYRFTVTVAFFALLFAITLVSYIANTKAKEERAKEDVARKLLLQQKRYQAIIDCSEDMIYEISLQGDSNIGSERIRKKFGWELPAHVEDLDFAKTMAILHVHPEDEEIFRKTILASGTGLTDELLVRLGTADGEYLWCQVTRTLLLDDNNEVVSILGKITDVDEEVKEREMLRLKSRTDPLTGLLNKVAFKKNTEEYLETNSTKNAAFLFVDMDHFKDVNDKLGHDMGDEVIKDTARKMQLLFANFDLVSQFGGDEFCVFVKDIPKETLIDKLQFANNKMKEVYTSGDKKVELSASIGVAYCLKDGVTYDELFEVADRAVYEAKDQGRDCFIIKEIV